METPERITLISSTSNDLKINRTLLSVLAILAVLVSFSSLAHADTFYLQAEKTFAQSDSDKTVWWDAPVGGTSMATLGASYAGNNFDLNGYTYKTFNTSSSSAVTGRMINSNKRLMIYSKDFDLAALDWSAAGSRASRDVTMRQSNASWDVVDLDVTNKMIVRANE